jgi:fumarate hydratase, class II
MSEFRKETDSLGAIDVPADKLWGAQTQRSLEYFSIGKDLMPAEMINAYALLKKASANVNHRSGRLDGEAHGLIVKACDEILAGEHHDMFPLHVWMTGSGTQFNMNVNEVVANRCSQLAGTPLGCKMPAHPNDHVNMAQSSNDTFPAAMYIAAAIGVKERLILSVTALHDAIAAKAAAWDGIIKIGRTRRSRSARNGRAMPACWLTISNGSRQRSEASIAWLWAALRSAPASTLRPALPKPPQQRSPN